MNFPSSPILVAASTLFLSINCAQAQNSSYSDIPEDGYGIELERYEYPFDVSFFEWTVGDTPLRMAYMVVQAEGEKKGTIVLMHGKNFCGAYWEQTARDLSEAGIQVIIPDQIGFGKSSKPVDYQFSFSALAQNTSKLLGHLGVEKVAVLGHSMGGMVASRFALQYPDRTEKLILVNPIGLEDWEDKGVPYRGVEAWYERELNKSSDSIRKYQLESYYDGEWKPEYDEWVKILVGMSQSDQYPQLARVQANTYDMIYTQPVVHDFPDISCPTLLIIGQRDRTALGKDLVTEEKKATLGQYPELGRATAEAIPNSKLVEIEGIGHLPHIEAYDRFIDPLLSFLE